MWCIHKIRINYIRSIFIVCMLHITVFMFIHELLFKVYKKKVRRWKKNILYFFISPRHWFAVPSNKIAIVLSSERFHNFQDTRDTGIDVKHSVWSSHVRFDPSRMNACGKDTIVFEINAHWFGSSVQGSLAASVWIKSSLLIIGDATKQRSHVDYGRTMNTQTFLSICGLLQ